MVNNQFRSALDGKGAKLARSLPVYMVAEVDVEGRQSKARHRRSSNMLTTAQREVAFQVIPEKGPSTVCTVC